MYIVIKIMDKFFWTKKKIGQFFYNFIISIYDVIKKFEKLNTPILWVEFNKIYLDIIYMY